MLCFGVEAFREVFEVHLRRQSRDSVQASFIDDGVKQTMDLSRAHSLALRFPVLVSTESSKEPSATLELGSCRKRLR